MGNDVATDYPMVEALILRLHEEFQPSSTDFIVRSMIHVSYEALGPYHFAKEWDVLVDNSAEEFAIQWMSFYNDYVGYRFY